MRAPALSEVLATAFFASNVLAIVSMKMSRGPELNPDKRRHLSTRAHLTAVLNNNVTGGSYYVEVNVGTPGQKQTLALDTGSTDVWLLSSTADLCTDSELQEELEDGCASVFDSSESSTFKVVGEGEFSIQYADESGADGDYITDTLQVGGASITALEMGYAYNATLGTGLIGVGYTINEASDSSETEGGAFTYPSIIDTMVSQGLIARKAYSLYLNDLEASTGNIIFGGLDSDKYHGDLLQLPVVPTRLRNGSSLYTDLGVVLTSFGITGQNGNTQNITTSGYKAQVILDSGTTLTYLPETLAAEIYTRIGATDDSENSGLIYVDCDIVTNSPALTFDYGFGGASGVSIKIPIDEVVLPLADLSSPDSLVLPELNYTNACGFAIFGTSEAPYILGDTFLRSAYVVYDLQSNEIAIAQTNFNSTSSNIVEFTATETGIPNVSGVASSAAVTATATGNLPGIGNGRTSAGTGTSSASASASSGTGSATGLVTTAGGTAASTPTSTPSASKSSSAGVSTVPAFDGRGLVVMGVAGVFAVLGGGWVL
ncbi:putative aspartic-type endopeptidase opsB, partial [Lachnellula suecica]